MNELMNGSFMGFMNSETSNKVSAIRAYRNMKLFVNIICIFAS